MGAGDGAIRLAEPLEDHRQHVGPNPDPRVGHGYHGAGVDTLESQIHGAPARRELDGIGEEVPEHLLEALRIAEHRPLRGSDPRADRDLLRFRLGADGLESRPQHRLEIHWATAETQTATHDGREIQEILDEPRLLLGIARDGLKRTVHRAGVVLGAAQHLRPSQDRIEGSPQLMGQRGEELVLRPVGGFRLLPSRLLELEQLLTLLFDPPPLRDVARDLGGADDAPPGIPDGRHRDRHVDETAVLGDSHGFEVVDALASPEAGEHLVLFCPPLLGDDQGDVAPHRLFRRPAEHPFRRGIPAGDDAVEGLADDDVVRRVDESRQPGLREVGGRRIVMAWNGDGHGQLSHVSHGETPEGAPERPTRAPPLTRAGSRGQDRGAEGSPAIPGSPSRIRREKSAARSAAWAAALIRDRCRSSSNGRLVSRRPFS